MSAVVSDDTKVTESAPLVILTDANFAAEVKQFDGVVLIDFWADWCGPCKAIAPFFEKLAIAYANNPKVKFAKLDTDANIKTSTEYMILSIPTIKYLVNGEVVDELNGFYGGGTGTMLEDKLKAVLARIAAPAK